MSLRETTVALAAQKKPIFVPWALPKTSLTAGVAETVVRKFGDGRLPPSPADLDEIQRRLIECLERSLEIESRDLRHAPQCVWAGENPIAGQPKLLERLLGILEHGGGRYKVRSLARLYLLNFRQGNESLKTVGRALSRMIVSASPLFHQLHERSGVFDPAIGPEMAVESLGPDDTPKGLLESYGLGGDILTSGFGVAVFRTGMADMRRQLAQDASPELIDRAVRWFDEAEYLDRRITLANTLLMPFQINKPTPDIRNRILDALLQPGRVGDPRLYSERWVRMSEAADVACSWLTSVALEQFLEIVDQVAYPDHWNYRRAFWLALHRKGAISRAWVAFGPLGAERARKDFGENIPFGRLVQTKKLVEPRHAVLVMKIGDFVAIDWSHQGRCIFWRDGDDHAPKLYEKWYSSGDIAPNVAPEGGIEKIHSQSDSYSWQRKIADFIRKNVGFDLHENDYRVT